MKVTFQERKLQTIELLAKLDNEGVLSIIEQLLQKSALFDGSVWSNGFMDDDEIEEEILEIRGGLYEA